MKLPTWEVAKELADKLPGGKGSSKDTECPECGADLKYGTKRPVNGKDKKGW
jgi:hypothetical protein